MDEIKMYFFTIFKVFLLLSSIFYNTYNYKIFKR